MPTNYFQKHQGQMLLVLEMVDDTLDVSPLGPPGAENLIPGAMRAKEYSTYVGVNSATIFSPDEQIVSHFVDGKVQPEYNNPYAGLL